MEPRTVATPAQKRKSPDEQETAALCTNGCGFFGTAKNNGLCSKCYSAMTAEPAAGCQATEADPAVHAAVVLPQKKRKLSFPAVNGFSSSDIPGGAVDTLSSQARTRQQQQDPAKPANRCLTCRRKVGLTGFRCRCGGTFCGSHRYPDAHSCGFDYKAAGREKIAKQNPVVIAPKLNRI